QTASCAQTPGRPDIIRGIANHEGRRLIDSVFTRGTFVEPCVWLLARTRLRKAMRTDVRSDDDRATECQIGSEAGEPRFELLQREEPLRDPTLDRDDRANEPRRCEASDGPNDVRHQHELVWALGLQGLHQ